jgi:hypothetical protein
MPEALFLEVYLILISLVVDSFRFLQNFIYNFVEKIMMEGIFLLFLVTEYCQCGGRPSSCGRSLHQGHSRAQFDVHSGA